MKNRWIVSRHDFVMHYTPDEAIAEARRLSAQENVPFHIYRVKEKLMVGNKPGEVIPVLPNNPDNKEQIA